ncbi:lysozyme inhibitor LprI family protein [Lysobacter sp. CA196]|uniref:lysozyme inhibitor LprI family protein n=1 Tax=Lysobacter sp. CA196 TaxID=3455606 RepID=UPI003F8D010F
MTIPALASSALLAVSLAASAPVLATTPAPAKPSFDCAKASMPIENAICKDVRLANADAAVGRAYERLRKSLDAQAAKGLREDQRWFVGVRDATYDNATPANRTRSLKALLDDRARALSQIRTNPSAGMVGSWRNVAGGVDVVSEGGGRFKVEANAAHPLDGRWLCDAAGSGRHVGAVLTVQVEGDPRSSLKLTREGAVLRVQALDANGKPLVGPDYCGFNGSVDGVYFAVPPSAE